MKPTHRLRRIWRPKHDIKRRYKHHRYDWERHEKDDELVSDEEPCSPPATDQPMEHAAGMEPGPLHETAARGSALRHPPPCQPVGFYFGGTYQEVTNVNNSATPPAWNLVEQAPEEEMDTT